MNIFPAGSLKRVVVESDQPRHWTLTEINGRLLEISGSRVTASLTFAFGLVLEAQQRGELVGWSTPSENSFYPPDAAERGVDLDSLVVVRVPDLYAVPRAGEKLLRSGAFGLVVLDIGTVRIPMPLQARLAGLEHSPDPRDTARLRRQESDRAGRVLVVRVRGGRVLEVPQPPFSLTERHPRHYGRAPVRAGRAAAHRPPRADLLGRWAGRCRCVSAGRH